MHVPRRRVFEWIELGFDESLMTHPLIESAGCESSRDNSMLVSVEETFSIERLNNESGSCRKSPKIFVHLRLSRQFRRLKLDKSDNTSSDEWKHWETANLDAVMRWETVVWCYQCVYQRQAGLSEGAGSFWCRTTKLRSETHTSDEFFFIGRSSRDVRLNEQLNPWLIEMIKHFLRTPNFVEMFFDRIPDFKVKVVSDLIGNDVDKAVGVGYLRIFKKSRAWNTRIW